MSELTDIMIDKEIDARGSFCPGPLMELIRGMKALPVGGVLAVLWLSYRTIRALQGIFPPGFRKPGTSTWVPSQSKAIRAS